jgi:transposase
MPWKECSVVEERLRFVARLLHGEAITDLCREFGISRKTGYKIFDRYKEHGLEARVKSTGIVRSSQLLEAAHHTSTRRRCDGR